MNINSSYFSFSCDHFELPESGSTDPVESGFKTLLLGICFPSLVSIDRDGQGSFGKDTERRAVSMVSGLKGNTYEDKLRELGMLNLEERRHQADMAHTFKIIRGVDMVKSDNWFRMVDQAGRATKSTEDPLNVRTNAAKAGGQEKLLLQQSDSKL